MVSCRVAGDAFQGVDAADTHVEFLGAELLDGLGITVGHLAFARQGEVPRGEDQCPGGEQARAERQQPTPSVIQCRLVQRSLDLADVVVCEPVRGGHEQRRCDRQPQHHSGDPAEQPSSTSWQSRPALQHKQTLDGTSLRRRPAYTPAPLSASIMRVPRGIPPGEGKDRAAARTSTLVSVAISAGLALAGLAKLLLRYGWRRLRVPKGRYRHGNSPG